MSKAFTKDDGPAAPEIARHRPPLPAGPNHVTAAGLRALRAELARLDAAPMEAGARGAAWRAELEGRIATAVVAAPPRDRDEVRLGARVGLRGADGHTRALTIVGVDEADASNGRIAFMAPVARALLGRRRGDVVSIRSPSGEDDVEIVSVLYAEP
ncbi:MAG TPA: GreA/GreB family elongation factor [Polyangia bacterium]|nr:GreA/GreB family elongation factor [Polyangia bacterium]